MKSNGNIFIHDTIINDVYQRGVDRCFKHYASAITGNYPRNTIIFSKRTLSSYDKKIIHPFSYHLNHLLHSHIDNFLDNVLCQIIANSRAKVYYSPYYGKAKTRIPQIFTAHDMIHEKFSHYYPEKETTAFIREKRDCFERATLILCVSNNTARDIQIQYPHLSLDKFKVIYHGIDESFFIYSHEPYRGKPYFLYVGNRFNYKNFPRLLIAFGKSGLSKTFDLRIISPSSDFPSDDEKEIIKSYGLAKNIHVEISVPDEILRTRYQQAFAYVFPSEYEGFGLPLLESMASGTLVLASNSSSLPEIGGEVPLYFDPLSVDSIINTLRHSSNLSIVERQKRITEGIRRAKEFSWTKSKKQFIETLSSLL